MTREQASEAIVAEASAAIAAGDYLTLERLYARLSPRPLDLALADAVANAILAASDTEIALETPNGRRKVVESSLNRYIGELQRKEAG